MFNFDTDKVINPITGDKVSVTDFADCHFQMITFLAYSLHMGFVVCDYHYGIALL